MNELNERESWSEWLSFSPVYIILIVLLAIAIPFILITFLEVSLGQGWFVGMIFLFLVFFVYQLRGIGWGIVQFIIGLGLRGGEDD